MTFNEAVELVTENGKHSRNDAAILISRLEKLGLLKLEYKPPSTISALCAIMTEA